MSYNLNLSKRDKIKFRIRKKVKGSIKRPRLVVYRSLNHIYAQLIDDINNKTITSVSSLNKDVQALLREKKSKIEKSKIVGKVLAEKATGLNVKKVVFDRNGYKYHGRVKGLEESARQAGLEF